jgi:hypothetical protein
VASFVFVENRKIEAGVRPRTSITAPIVEIRAVVREIRVETSMTESFQKAKCPEGNKRND